MAKKTTQDKADFVDQVVTEKGTVKISMKTAKWIIGTLIGLTLFILGVAYGFKASVEGKIDNVTSQMKKDKTEILNKIDGLKKDEIKPNTIKNYNQDGDIKVLFERTNSRQNIIPTYYERPDDINTLPPDIMNGGNDTIN